jgi:hypothetical protein
MKVSLETFLGFFKNGKEKKQRVRAGFWAGVVPGKRGPLHGHIEGLISLVTDDGIVGIGSSGPSRDSLVLDLRGCDLAEMESRFEPTDDAVMLEPSDIERVLRVGMPNGDECVIFFFLQAN